MPQCTQRSCTEYNLGFQQHPLPLRRFLTESQTRGADNSMPTKPRSTRGVRVFHMFTIERITTTDDGDFQVVRNDILADHLVKFARSSEK